MTQYVEGINPAMLRWARECAGLTQEDVGVSFGKKADVIIAWENGNKAPTYNQLEKLAYQLYKRPLAVFFLPEPPEEPDIKQSFRTLPEFELENLSTDTLHNIRLARSMQLGLIELTDGSNPSERQIFRDIRIDLNTDIAKWASVVREYLGVSLESQTQTKNHDEALKTWRDAIQDCGVFVFKRSFKQRDISGFCIEHNTFPIIFLNNSTAKSRQIFSIFHELSHLLIGESGITKSDDRYIETMSGTNEKIETACNRFAGEFLVPSNHINQWFRINPEDEYVSNLADYYRVSREVVLRKFLDNGYVDKSYYEKKRSQWHKEYIDSRDDASPGGNYYLTQASYLGEKYLRLAFSKYYQGAISVEQLADYLNVKTGSIPGLEPLVFRKAEY